MDSARERTDKELVKMEERITEIYQKSAHDLYKKWDAYMERAEKRIEGHENALRAALDSGDKDSIAKAKKALETAKTNVTLRDKYYRDMLDSVTDQLAKTNETALEYINGQMPKIYAWNYNEAGNIADEVGIKFNLINEDVVKRRILDGDITTPFMVQGKHLDIPKDKRWNTKQINSAVLQGIIQGESMQQISRRLFPHMLSKDLAGNNLQDLPREERRAIIHKNRVSAIRNARTMVTGAENLGRQDSYNRLEQDGLVLKKVWMATPDGRTRDWHIDMDGQEVGIHENFIDGLGNELEYPGDPVGDPATVYNCFIGETSVAVNSDVVRTYKHEYDGDLITIKTAGGVEFTCTPNHPILTTNGWIHANLLNKGNNILVTFIGDERTFRSNPYIKHVFTRFDAVHKFFDKGICQRATALDVNFHGDIPTADVEIVTEERFLRDNRDVGGSKFINEFLFKSSDVPFASDSTLMEHFGGVGKPTLGDVSGEGKAFSFFGCGLRHSKIHGLRPVAWGDSGFFKPIDDNGSCDTVILGECLNGFTGMVFADEIIYVNVVRSHAFVYNLQSENGYYYVNNIIAENDEKNNGIMAIAKNCRCTMVTDVSGFRRADGTISEIRVKDADREHTDAIAAERAKR